MKPRSNPSEPPKRLLLALRIGLGIFFCTAALAKLLAPAATEWVFAEKGLPEPLLVGLLVGGLELVVGVMLLVGARVASVARAAAAVLIVVALAFHLPLGESHGAAHARAVALTLDIFVILGLLTSARYADASHRGRHHRPWWGHSSRV